MTGGNTKPQSSRSRKYVFTFNNYTENDWTHITHCTDSFSEIVMQEETGESGTPHLQGYLKCKNAKTFEAVKKIISDKIHIEKCKDREAAIEYCSKEDTRTGRQFRHGVSEAPVVVFEPCRPLNKWQQDLLDELDTPPLKRNIKWIWCSSGGTGKTDIAKYYCSMNRKTSIFVCGAAKDIKCGICKHFEKNSKLNVVLFGLTRSVEDFVSYQAIEEVKDGIFFSGKYESGMMIYENPHVVILANFAPDLSKLSADRWDVFQIDEIVGMKDFDSVLC